MEIKNSWIVEFVRESNKIDPQPGYANEPGSPRWDNHEAALQHAINKGNSGRLCNPREVHRLLMQPFLENAGQYRDCGVRVGRWVKPQAEAVPELMKEWDLKAYRILTALRSKPVDQEKGRKAVEDLHCEFENIHPWVDGNGRSGRILMVNHALFIKVAPWILHEGKQQENYYRMIEAHESHKRLSRDMYMLAVEDLLTREGEL